METDLDDFKLELGTQMEEMIHSLIKNLIDAHQGHIQDELLE